MHEASLMRDLMQKIFKVAAEGSARNVTSVRVWLGALSHMSPDHFREHFETASLGTIAENAALKFETSTDIGDSNAQDIVLLGIEVET